MVELGISLCVRGLLQVSHNFLRHSLQTPRAPPAPAAAVTAAVACAVIFLPSCCLIQKVSVFGPSTWFKLPNTDPVEADARRRSTVATALAGSDTDNVRVDGAGHAVEKLNVKLRKDVFCQDAPTLVQCSEGAHTENILNEPV
jgi:hypothetical protein